MRAEGYDPYSEAFGDASVLGSRYDFVTAQDVLERVDDPRALVDDLKNYMAPTGCIAIGTPNEDAIDLHDQLESLSSARTRKRIRWYRSSIRRFCADI